MIRLLAFVVFLGFVALGLSWFADQPGSVVLNWMGYEIETSFYVAFLATFLLVGMALVGWSLLRHLVAAPASIYRFFDGRRRKRGHEALSSGLIAISAGDRAQAVKYSNLARQALPNDPVTALLRAQTAQLCGDRATARRIYASMIEVPDTELLGLRGLFLEAQRENEVEAARQFAERAVQRDPKLDWAVEALFDIQCRAQDWDGALSTLAIARAQKHFDKKSADRKRAVLLTAQAMEAEDSDMDAALALATEAHNLAPDLVPAGTIAGRVLASKGQTKQAAKVIGKTWRASPHPDLAVVYAFARPGDATRDRLTRVKQLAAMKPHNIEGRIAVAHAAIEAVDFEEARASLEPLLRDEPTQRICTLMARIEAAEHGNKGRVREWLARGLRAPRDPVWTADGHVSEHWLPVSPVTGRLDAFSWRVPIEAMDEHALDVSVEDLLALESMNSGVLLEDGSEVADSDDVLDVPAAENKPLDGAAPDAKNGIADDVNLPVVHEGAEVAVHEAASSDLAEDEAKSDVPVDTQEPVTLKEADADEPSPVPKTDGRGKKSGKGKKRKTNRVSKTRIFVSPRAPDDPGPDPVDPDEARTPLARFRMPASKGSS